MAGELKAIKITNPNYVGVFAHLIKHYCDKVKSPNVTYESLYSYLVTFIQYGRDKHELWVVLDGNKPVAFANWKVAEMPYISTIALEYMSSIGAKKDAVKLLIEKLIEFSAGQRCTYVVGMTAEKRLFDHFGKIAKSLGGSFDQLEKQFFIARK